VKVRRVVGLWVVLGIATSGVGSGSETDNLTYRFLRLEDSGPKLNGVFNSYLDVILRKTNEKLTANGADPRRASDTEVELTFVRTYVDEVVKRFGDRLLPVFGTCIEKNDCPDWPPFERIPLETKESIYGQAGYNKVAIAFLAPSFQLCGVRLGTDKLTHLFSHGFFYYNAGRLKRVRLDEEEARRMSLADEWGLMGARSTAVVSPADAQATVAGYRLATDYFLGENPVFSRNSETGLLQKRRDLDVCSYVSQGFDEVVNPPTYTAGRRRVARLEAAIAERRAFNDRAEKSLTPEEKRAWKDRIVGRPLDSSHARLPFVYKIYLVFKYIVAYLTIPKESRAPASFVVFPDFKLKDRRPIVLRHEPARSLPSR
jgi:hypothetical protein